MNEWQNLVGAAQIDLKAAYTGNNEQALMHLRDALENVKQAIEMLEEEE